MNRKVSEVLDRSGRLRAACITATQRIRSTQAVPLTSCAYLVHFTGSTPQFYNYLAIGASSAPVRGVLTNERTKFGKGITIHFELHGRSGNQWHANGFGWPSRRCYSISDGTTGVFQARRPSTLLPSPRPRARAGCQPHANHASAAVVEKLRRSVAALAAPQRIDKIRLLGFTCYTTCDVTQFSLYLS